MTLYTEDTTVGMMETSLLESPEHHMHHIDDYVHESLAERKEHPFFLATLENPRCTR